MMASAGFELLPRSAQPVPPGCGNAGILQRAPDPAGCAGECASAENPGSLNENRGILPRKASGADSGGSIPRAVFDVLDSPGQPLDGSTRAFMEPRFGHDFSRVRVHSDARAAESARSVNALAYTVGNDIAFGTGLYAPETAGGRRLLAHELAHVKQQGGFVPPMRHTPGGKPGAQQGGSVPPMRHTAGTTPAAQQGGFVPERAQVPLALGAPDTASEREADRAAGLVAVARQAAVTSLASGVLQRQTAPPTPQPAGQQPATQPAQPAAPTRPERESLDPAGKPGKPVLAEVYRDRGRPGDPAVLTVTLRTSVVFAERPLGTNPGEIIQLPSPAQQAAWRRNFQERVTKAWSFKHFLDLDGPCPGERPRAVVNFKIAEQTPPDVTIYVYSWTPSGWRSYVQGNVMHLDIGDVDANFGSGQVVASHETGHSLGLSHIGCDTNDLLCYGIFNDAADIMGGGPTVSARDYQTFADIMGQVTGCRWKVTPASAPPHNYLPTALGFAMGVVGAVLGGLIGFSLGGPLGAFIGAGIGGLALGFGFGALAGVLGMTAS